MSLPANWVRYTTEDGKEYFHNQETNVTQWERPAWPQSQAPAGLSADGETSDVFQYKPTTSDLELHERQSDKSGNMVEMMSQSTEDTMGKSSGHSLTMTENETVSLHDAPGGRIQTGENSGMSSASGGGSNNRTAISGVITADSADSSDSGMPGFAGSMLTYAQHFFDVNTDDVVRRLKLALLPYPPQPSSVREELRARPDFYGPFWVATTAVLFLAATGNFARVIEAGDHKDFKPDYGLVNIAAAMVYGCLLAVPLIVRASLYFSGDDSDSIDIKQMICVYGYSLAPTIPASILCLVPLNQIRWMFCLAGLVVSLMFMHANFWVDVSVKAAWLKWIVVIMPGATLATTFLVYKIHFFSYHA